MVDSFTPTQALLRECLEYPGQSYETLKGVLGLSSASMIASWLRGETTPKRPSDWPVIHRKIEAHLGRLKIKGADPNLCDPQWAERFRAYCTEHNLTPEEVASTLDVSERHGRRWHQWGEVPVDRHRGTIAEMTGFDFVASVYRRAIVAAAKTFGKPFPTSLASLMALVEQSDARADDFHRVIHDALIDARTRGGVTSKKLANHLGTTKGCVEAFVSRSTNQMNYGAIALASMLVGLATYVTQIDAQLGAGGGSGAARALAELRSRPKPPSSGPVKARTTVRWDRIEEALERGTHRSLRYRCPSGEFAAVVLIRFCIAYEQSRRTTTEFAAATGFSESRLGTWFNGRRLPDESMLGRLEQALEKIGGKRAPRTAPPHEDHVPAPAAAPPTSAARPTPPAAPPPPIVDVEEHAPRTDAHGSADDSMMPVEGVSEFTAAALTLMFGLQRAVRDGNWQPSPTAVKHLRQIAQIAAEVGGLTADDLRVTAPIVVQGTAPALRELMGTPQRPLGQTNRRKGGKS